LYKKTFHVFSSHRCTGREFTTVDCDELESLPVLGGEKHSAGFDSTYFRRFQVGNNDDCPSDNFFRLVEQRDPGDQLTLLSADINLEAEKLVRAFDFLSFQNLCRFKLDLTEVVNSNHVFGCDNDRLCGFRRF
jgi:hypothetical protein